MESARRAGLVGAVEHVAAVPLRVAVYARITEAIRDGRLPTSSLLPSESELSAAMGVSRTVVREALMLAEEDGYVRARRGIGRFVADRPPRVGLERLRAPEELLGGSGRVEVERIRSELVPVSPAFEADHLLLDRSEPSWFVESLISLDGRAVAIVQEHLPDGDRLRDLGPEVLQEIESAPGPSRTVLAALLTRPITSARTTIRSGPAGRTRAALLDLAAEAPILVLTQTVEVSGRPDYLSKLLVNTDAVELEVVHPGSAASALS